MAEVHCKRCGSVAFVKNGIVRGHQRYHCRDCGCNFTNTPRRGKPPAMRALAVLLYAMGNMSYGMIARLFGVSEVAVFKWIRKEAVPRPRVPRDIPDGLSEPMEVSRWMTLSAAEPRARRPRISERSRLRAGSGA